MATWNAAQRQARARALGFANYNQYRRANAGTKAAARARIGDTTNQRRATATETQNAARRLAAADAVTQLRGGELTSSGNSRVLLAAVKRAANRDRSLTAIVTVRVIGGGLVDVHLWNRGYSASLFLDDIRDYAEGTEASGVKPAFLSHLEHAMARAGYPEQPDDGASAVEHVDLTASD